MIHVKFYYSCINVVGFIIGSATKDVNIIKNNDESKTANSKPSGPQTQQSQQHKQSQPQSQGQQQMQQTQTQGQTVNKSKGSTAIASTTAIPTVTATATATATSAAVAASAVQGNNAPSRLAIHYSDADLIVMLQDKPKNREELRTERGFKAFFTGVSTSRMKSLLHAAYSGGNGSGGAEEDFSKKITKRMSLLQDVLIEG